MNIFTYVIEKYIFNGINIYFTIKKTMHILNPLNELYQSEMVLMKSEQPSKMTSLPLKDKGV